MHTLSTTFMHCLKRGFLSGITEYVRNDCDLDLEIRDSYVNVYYKGNSMLKLAETGSLLHYRAEIHEKFRENLEIPLDFTEDTVSAFIGNVPLIKENIVKHGQNSIELEYEQMIIRANNSEFRNNTEYFIVDRQFAVQEGRFDLCGVYWSANGRRKYQEVPVCLIEIKFALNSDIRSVHEQLARYYEPIKNNAECISRELEAVFRQKLELGLYHQPAERINAMKTLTFSRDIGRFQFILILVDYNDNSCLFDLENIKSLEFAGQVRVFRTGFGMWGNNVAPI